MKAILYILSRAPACSSWDDKRCDSNMITIQEQEARPWDSTVELLQRDIPFSLAGPAHSLRYVVPLRGNWERRDWLKILGTSDTMNCVSGTTNSQSAPSSLCYIKSARPYRWLSQKELVKIKSGNPRGWSPDLVLQIIHWLCELGRITLTLWILVSSVVTLEARAWLGMIPTQEGCPIITSCPWKALLISCLLHLFPTAAWDTLDSVALHTANPSHLELECQTQQICQPWWDGFIGLFAPIQISLHGFVRLPAIVIMR